MYPGPLNSQNIREKNKLIYTYVYICQYIVKYKYIPGYIYLQFNYREYLEISGLKILDNVISQFTLGYNLLITMLYKS